MCIILSFWTTYLYSDTLIFNTGIDIDFYRGAFHSDVIYQFFVQLIHYIMLTPKENWKISPMCFLKKFSQNQLYK